MFWCSSQKTIAAVDLVDPDADDRCSVFNVIAFRPIHRHYAKYVEFMHVIGPPCMYYVIFEIFGYWSSVADLAIGAGGRFAPPRPAWLYDGAPQDQTCHG